MIENYDGSQDLNDKVVRFTADWCQPCKKYAPLFDKAADSQGETWLVVDVEEYPDAAHAFNVRSIPAVFNRGVKVEDYMKWTREKF